MTWHWSYKSLPELAGLPDDEKWRVWERARRRAMRRPHVLTTAMGKGCVTPAGLLAVIALLRSGWPAWAALPAVIGVGGVGSVGLDQALLHAIRRHVRPELPGRCRGCGYDLTGNASGRCPECGRAADRLRMDHRDGARAPPRRVCRDVPGLGAPSLGAGLRIILGGREVTEVLRPREERAPSTFTANKF